METLDAIRTRRVVRAYADRQIEADKLVQIVDAGRHAMSARNLQPWQFIIIRSRDKIREIAPFCTTGKFVADAQAVIVVLKDTNNERWADVDCGQAVQNMATAAWSFGLGLCWVGHFDAPEILKRLGVPGGWALFTILPLGYPDPKTPPKNQVLKPKSETVHFEHWGGQPA
jgi:nitroreductase